MEVILLCHTAPRQSGHGNRQVWGVLMLLNQGI